MKALSLVFSALLAMTSVVAVADDSSAIDSSTISAAVQNSTGLMIRVPVDAQGRELQAAAELRVVNAQDSSTEASNLPSLWSSGVDTTKAPQLDSSTDNSDSSTRRWGWSTWYGGWGWNTNYYYNWYTPTYWYGNYSWNYGNPYYYNYYSPYYYNGYNCWGYRYYYYGRRW